MINTLRTLKLKGSNQSFQKDILSFDERFEILGLRRYLEQERIFSDLPGTQQKDISNDEL